MFGAGRLHTLQVLSASYSSPSHNRFVCPESNKNACLTNLEYMKYLLQFIKYIDPQMRLATPFIRIADRVLANFVDPRKLILQTWDGAGRLKNLEEKKLCLFAHFDAKNRIADYVLNYVKSLHEIGSDVIFISTCEKLSEVEVSKILPYCVKVILRKNITLDFGSWCVGLYQIQNLADYSTLILANDSVYGPIYPLKEIFSTMSSKKLSFWGITSTSETKYHIQSYFLVFDKGAVQSEAFTKFWKAFRFYRCKSMIIEKYEIGLTTWARQFDWTIGAYVEHSQITPRDINPMLFFWDSLIENYRCPFLKTEVLRLNRAQMKTVSNWRKIIESHSTYDTNLISDNLL